MKVNTPNIKRRIRIRRGTEDQRKQIIFEEGEMAYITDTKSLYVGDNNKYGGILVSTKNVITETENSTTSPFEIVYNKTTKETDIIDSNNNKIQITTHPDSLSNCCSVIQKQITDIDKLLDIVISEMNS